MSLQIALDVGGTFTDGILLDTETNRILVAKALTTPSDPGDGIAAVAESLMLQARAPASGFEGKVGRVVHGTTLVTNTLLERRGVATALVVIEGTLDALDIRRELRYDIYDLNIEYPQPLVPLQARFAIRGRLGPRGEEWSALRQDDIEHAAAGIASGGYQSIAVCLLHAAVDGRHEQQVAEALAKTVPALPLSLSSEIAAEIGEYERMSTTVANAYVQPLVETYLASLRDRLRALGIDGTIDIMLSNGAFTTAEIAAKAPIRILESGPAGGVLSGVNCGLVENVNHVLAFDMGGTTAKAGIAVDGKPNVTHVFEFGRVQRFKRGSGLPVVAPSIDLIEIGAGGGSIARLNQLGLMQVGPQSAGAEPGPACYGQGGTEATVTDADLVLGYLDADNFLGGAMRLDVEAARAALARMGDRLGLGVEETAWGIHDIVNENMAGAARTHIAEQGLDARQFTMVATGGAGPVHGVDVARRLRIGEVMSPIASGVGSCLGFLAAPARSDRSWSRVERLAELDATDLEQRIAAAQQTIIAELAETGLPATEIRWRLAAEIRYHGQGDSVEVVLSQRPAIKIDPASAVAAFETEYRRLYGRTVPGGVAEVVTWRLAGESENMVRQYALAEIYAKDRSTEPTGQRRLYLPASKAYQTVPVHERARIPPGATLAGPLVLTEPESTLIVAYPATVTVLASGSVHVMLEDSR
ncbi:MAG: hydantoinase/oxoprolinase family protein [Proteobacteria bacterium]|nr:hydantoinase/oxoprolinase family protein [Pseudomonadota bacterium]